MLRNRSAEGTSSRYAPLPARRWTTAFAGREYPESPAEGNKKARGELVSGITEMIANDFTM